MHQQLWDAAIASGVQLLTGIKIQAVDVETTTVTLQDGEVVSADLIIGADGARVSLSGSQEPPESAD